MAVGFLTIVRALAPCLGLLALHLVVPGQAQLFCQDSKHSSSKSIAITHTTPDNFLHNGVSQVTAVDESGVGWGGRPFHSACHMLYR